MRHTGTTPYTAHVPPRKLNPYIAWAPATAWALFIFLLGGWSSPPQPEFAKFELADKLAHATLYGMLALLVFRALRQTTELRRPTCLLAVIGIVALYGAADEVRQLFIPHRQGDVWDWVADTTGALAAVGMVMWAGRKKYGRTGELE